MAKRDDSYATSRWNSTRWGIFCNGAIPCLGRERCAYSDYCETRHPDLELPEPGQGRCPVEQAFAVDVYCSLVRLWSGLDEYLEPDLDQLIFTTITIMLQRMRAMARQNIAWDYMTDDPKDLAVAEREFRLTSRYLTAIAHDYDAILALVDDALERKTYQEWRLEQWRLGLMEIVDGLPVPMRTYPGLEGAADAES